MLIAFSGLPGTGKTTLARALAGRLQATYIRIDTIEDILLAQRGEALVAAGAGYCVAYALAEDNLKLGRTVVADSVNPITVTRNAWREAAMRSGVPVVEVHVCCSDIEAHRSRIEARLSGTRGSDWTEIRSRKLEAAHGQAVMIDTAARTVEQCLVALECALLERSQERTTTNKRC